MNADRPVPGGARPPTGVPRRRALPGLEAAVAERPALPGRTLPLLFTPADPAVDLVTWAAARRDAIGARLHEHGALLFRGFGGMSQDVFEAFVRAVSGDPLEYTQRSSPRSAVGGNIYTSTEQPADQTIFLHNEHSYTLNWPMRLFFYCATEPGGGGATPLADVRRVLGRIPAEVRDRFTERDYAYVRHYRRGLGVEWTEAFQTTDPADVERECAADDIGLRWLPDGGLTTTQVRPLVRTHPVTGEGVWFNHMAFFHDSTLRADIRASLLAGMDAAELPHNTYYGDGEPIEPEVVAAIRDAYEAESVAVPWRRGDILMIDNMLAAHGRETFTPPRRILLAITEPYAGFAGAGR
ncbi:TauD/TfdA family dioxygenase [Actinomadura sp. 1N219]|uniref:TauD/TfdA family dioxygenase n=1 Tax=Actinomadura sp. 1N219 TaxID=3375152 RepID=UPI003793A202